MPVGQPVMHAEGSSIGPERVVLPEPELQRLPSAPDLQDVRQSADFWSRIRIMKVANLMKLLASMDPEAVVVVPGYELGVDGVDRVEAVQVQLHAVRWSEGVFVGKELLGERYEGLHKLSPEGVPGVR